MSLRDSAETTSMRIAEEQRVNEGAKALWRQWHPDSPTVFHRSELTRALAVDRPRGDEPNYYDLTDTRARSLSNPDYYSVDRRFEFKSLGENRYLIKRGERTYARALGGWPAVGERLQLVANDPSGAEYKVEVTRLFVRPMAASGTVHLRF